LDFLIQSRKEVEMFEKGKILNRVAGIILMVIVLKTSSVGQVRIKDITQIMGLEKKQVIGYGLVTGLNATGDGMRALFTIQSVANMLKRMGLTIDADRIRMRNVAAVMVIAEIPPFAKRGQAIDVVVSSMGDATSLEGGTLIQTPLTDLSNNAFVGYAQGIVTSGGLNAHTGGGAVPLVNSAVTCRVLRGCIIEQDQLLTFVTNNLITLTLNEPDFTSAFRIAEKINREFNGSICNPLDAATVRIQIPQSYVENDEIVEFMSIVERLPVQPDVTAKVVINERTGTIVVGNEVKLSTVAISHGDLSIQIQAAAGQQQAAAVEGRTIVIDQNRGGTVGDLAEALNALGARPRDMVAIFQALKTAGALKAEVVIM